MLLQQLVSRFSQNGLENNSLIKLVQEIPILINEQDLQISQKSLRFITGIHYFQRGCFNLIFADVVSSYPDQISDTLPTLLDSLIKITQGSLLQGSTLNAALALFSALVKSPLPNKPSFEVCLSK
jgi:hypothetical protein